MERIEWIKSRFEQILLESAISSKALSNVLELNGYQQKDIDFLRASAEIYNLALTLLHYNSPVLLKFLMICEENAGVICSASEKYISLLHGKKCIDTSRSFLKMSKVFRRNLNAGDNEDSNKYLLSA